MKYKNVHYEAEREVRLTTVSNHLTRWPKRLELYGKEPSIYFRDHPAYKIPVPYVKFFISPRGTNQDMLRHEGPPTETVSQMKRRRLKEEEMESRELLPITEVSIGPMARKDEAKLV